MMLAVAIWMLERVIDDYISMLLYAILGIGFSIYLGALDKGGHIFKKSAAVVLFVYSLSLLIGVLAGSTSLAKPLEFLKPQTVNSLIEKTIHHTKFTKVTSIDGLNKLLKENKGKNILLDFSASWCSSCKELENITFSNPEVKDKMKEFILIQADITENSAQNKALSKRYGVFGPPAILFFNKNGDLLKSKTIIGFIQPNDFLKHLNKL
jgi:thiol:disulfide interchange protein DsbD